VYLTFLTAKCQNNIRAGEAGRGMHRSNAGDGDLA
jgi:hypothetical protein